MVLSQEGVWRVRVGEKVSRAYESRQEALRAAFKHASAISKEGLESEVVMRVMTLQFGPNDHFKAIPTLRDRTEDGDSALEQAGRGANGAA